MDKNYLYLIIVGVVLYIIVQNRNDAEDANRTGGTGYRPVSITPVIGRQQPPTGTVTAPQQPKKTNEDLIDQGQRKGEGLIL